MKTYTYKGQRVFIERIDLMEGIEPIATDGAGIGCYPVEIYNGQDTCLAQDENYYGDTFDELEIMDIRCVNPENEQRLIDGWWTKDYAEWDLINRELCTDTTRYYDWTSELTRFTNRLREEYKELYEYDELEDFDKAKWETEWSDTCSSYISKWSIDNPMEKPIPPSIDEIIKTFNL